MKHTPRPIESRRTEIQKLSFAPMGPVAGHSSVQREILPIGIGGLSATMPLVDHSIVTSLRKLLVVCPWIDEATMQ
jgi:hypothetical protein